VRAPFDLDAIDRFSRDDLAAVLARLAARLAQLGSEAPAPPCGRLVTAKELAADLSLTLDAVYEMARTGRVPIVRKGRAVRFHLAAVRRALAS